MKTTKALALELREYIKSRRNVVLFVAVPAFLASLGGAVVGGIIAGQSAGINMQERIDRANTLRQIFDAENISLQSGAGRLGSVIVVPKSNATLVQPIICPPHITNKSHCFRIVQEEK